MPRSAQLRGSARLRVWNGPSVSTTMAGFAASSVETAFGWSMSTASERARPGAERSHERRRGRGIAAGDHELDFFPPGEVRRNAAPEDAVAAEDQDDGAGHGGSLITCVARMTVAGLPTGHPVHHWNSHPGQGTGARVMKGKGKFDAFRHSFGEFFTALLFTAVVVVVVGGTTAMLLERPAIYA